MGSTELPAPTDRPLSPRISHDPLVRAFRLVATAEAFSWAGLLIGMLLKHVLDLTEAGVTVFGPVHGVLVLLYVLLAVVLTIRLRWGVGTVLLAMAATVPPFLTLGFDRWAGRTGRYGRV